MKSQLICVNMLKVMSAIIIFPSTNTDLKPVVSKYHERQQIRVNKENSVSDLILGNDKEGNKMVRSAMRTIKHSHVRGRLGHAHSRSTEGDAIVRKMTFMPRGEG